MLAPKIYDAGTIFHQFSYIKSGGRSQQLSIPGSGFVLSLSVLELAILRKANLVFQWLSVSNATLLSIVFFACGVHKLNYIKNDFI